MSRKILIACAIVIIVAIIISAVIWLVRHRRSDISGLLPENARLVKAAHGIRQVERKFADLLDVGKSVEYDDAWVEEYRFGKDGIIQIIYVHITDESPGMRSANSLYWVFHWTTLWGKLGNCQYIEPGDSAYRTVAMICNDVYISGPYSVVAIDDRDGAIVMVKQIGSTEMSIGDMAHIAQVIIEDD